MAVNENQKGGRLTDDLLTDEVLDSSDSVLKKGGTHGQVVGLQQHFTPEKPAQFIAEVLGKDKIVLDPTAGDGSLLAPFAALRRFGIELDRQQMHRGSYKGIGGDVQRVFPILNTYGGLQFQAAVVNPPFGLEWQDSTFNDGRPVSSTLLGWQYADALLNRRAMGALICGRERFDREVLPNSAGRFCFIIEVDDLWEDVSLPCVVAFWVKQLSQPFRPVAWPPVAKRIKESSSRLNKDNAGLIHDVQAHSLTFNPAAGQAGYAYLDDFGEAWKAIQVEYDRRLGKRIGQRKSPHDLSVHGGKVHFAPTPLARRVLERDGKFGLLQGINRKAIEWFAFNRKEWDRILQWASELEGFSICPRMVRSVNEVIEESLLTKVPMYELKPQMRLGFLTDLDRILCTKSDPDKGFEAGQKYPITCTDAEYIETENNRPVETGGGVELKNFRIRRKYLNITITVGGYRSEAFGESKEEIEYLLEHFDIPDPGTVATRDPKGVKDAVRILREIEGRNQGRYPYDDEERGWVKGEPHIWNFKPFQVLDLSRLATKRRGILAWKQGLGKTLAGLAWIEMMVELGRKRQALIVCPADLIPNWLDEAEKYLGYQPEVIGSIEKAREVARHLRNGGEGVYITHYEMMSRAGAAEEPLPADWYGEPFLTTDEEGEQVVKRIPMMGYTYEPAHKEPYWDEEGRYQERDVPGERKFRTAGTNCPQCGADYDSSWRVPTSTRPGLCDPHKVARTLRWKDKDGKTVEREEHGCGYVHVGNPKGKPTRQPEPPRVKGTRPKAQKVSTQHHRVPNAASILSTSFRHGILILDELTKISGPSGISKAIRGINCDCVLGLTGTPIKNYIKDAFWGLWKCVGNQSARFPYDYEGQSQFSQDFSVYEWEVKDDGKLGVGKPQAGVTNLMKLWALLSCCLIRRTKEETGEEIVPRTFYPTIVPLGTAQRLQTQAWLQKFSTFFENENPDHPVVQAGMHHLLAPLLGMHWKLEFAATLPECDPDRDYWEIPVSNWTPAVVKTLEIAMHHVARGERVLIGSDIIPTAAFIAEELCKRTVNGRPIDAQTMLVEGKDGPPKTKTPAKRASVVREFQGGDADVLCAGIQAMAYGHNLDKGNVVILHGLPWDYAGLDQFLDRVHRLTSEKPVSIYVILSEGTITQKKWQLLCDKGDAANLALDGRLVEQQEAEISEADVVRELIEKGIPVTGREVPEKSIEEAWAKITCAEDLGEFVRPEPEAVMAAEAEKTDATTFDIPDPDSEDEEVRPHVKTAVIVSQLDGFASASFSTFTESEVTADAGELREGAVPEEGDESAGAREGVAGGDAPAEGEEAPESVEEAEERVVAAEEPLVVAEPITAEEAEMHRDLDRELYPEGDVLDLPAPDAETLAERAEWDATLADGLEEAYEAPSAPDPEPKVEPVAAGGDFFDFDF